MLTQVEPGPDEEVDETKEELDSQEEEEVSDPGPTMKKRKENALVRTETLGASPKGSRAALRKTTEQSFYVCLSGTKRIRTLRILGACYQILGADYLEYAFHGKAMPKVDEYDCTCKHWNLRLDTNSDFILVF